MKLRGVLVGLGVVVLAGCSGQAVTQGSPTPVSQTSAVVISSAVTTTKTTPTTAATAILSDLCDRHCDTLAEVQNLPPCSTGTDCIAQVRQADQAIDALRQDMIDHNISREKFIDLDDALTNATEEIDSYDLLGCVDEVKGSQDMFVCAIDALSVKTTVGTVAITLGSLGR